MIVTARAIAEYRQMLSRISAKAADEIQQYMIDHHFEVDETFIDFVDSIVTKYGEAAGSLSAQFYDNLAKYWGQSQNGGTSFQKPLQTAEVAELPTREEVAKVVYGTMKESPNKIPSTAGRLVKRTAEDTTLKNAIRDGAQFAWVTSGDTCPFCLMLASRGWQYASKKALKNGHAEHIHPNCDCTYVVRFDSSSTVAGYDPKMYRKIYDEAEGNNWREKLNYIRRELSYDTKVSLIDSYATAILKKAKENGIVKINVSNLPNGLPIKYKPFSILDKTAEDGMVIQRRVYGDDGYAAIDYDTSDHHRPDLHPTGAHKNIIDLSKKNPHSEPYHLSKEELELNSDIIQEGINYYET